MKGSNNFVRRRKRNDFINIEGHRNIKREGDTNHNQGGSTTQWIQTIIEDNRNEGGNENQYVNIYNNEGIKQPIPMHAYENPYDPNPNNQNAKMDDDDEEEESPNRYNTTLMGTNYDLYYDGYKSTTPPFACTKPHGRQQPLRSLKLPSKYSRNKGITVKGLARGTGLAHHTLKRIKLKQAAERMVREKERKMEEKAKLEQYGAFFPTPQQLNMPSVMDIMNRELRWKQRVPGGPRYFKKTDVLRAIAERKMALQHTYAMIIAEKTREQLHQLQVFNENVCDRKVERTAPSYIS
mmetsp:Transcript_11123/g.16379  ORF Transcript_11123/g.16379 Transcript_11123/m.16379 type:complete len:294 (+) Transcript_11123:233-1114(+)